MFLPILRCSIHIKGEDVNAVYCDSAKTGIVETVNCIDIWINSDDEVE